MAQRQTEVITLTRVGVGIVAAITVVSATGCGSALLEPGGPKGRASADTAELLGSFRPPPGAERRGGRPAGTPKALDEPMTRPNTPNLVTMTGWWTASGTPDSVISWESSHPPKGLGAAGSGSTGGLGRQPDALLVTLAAPPIAGVLPSRELLIQAARLDDGGTVIRVDAQDIWLPGKPASEAIPPAAVLTLRAVAPRRPRPMVTPSPTAPPAPRVMTVTDPTVIARAARLVQALPRTERNVRLCGAAYGTALDLTFASAPHGPPTATVRAEASGCGFVSVTVHGKAQPTLDDGWYLIERLQSLLHVRWPALGV